MNTDQSGKRQLPTNPIYFSSQPLQTNPSMTQNASEGPSGAKIPRQQAPHFCPLLPMTSRFQPLPPQIGPWNPMPPHGFAPIFGPPGHPAFNWGGHPFQQFQGYQNVMTSQNQMFAGPIHPMSVIRYVGSFVRLHPTHGPPRMAPAPGFFPGTQHSMTSQYTVNGSGPQVPKVEEDDVTNQERQKSNTEIPDDTYDSMTSHNTVNGSGSQVPSISMTSQPTSEQPASLVVSREVAQDPDQDSGSTPVAPKRKNANRQMKDPNDPLNKKIPDGIEIDTKEITTRVEREMSQHRFPKKRFAERVLCRCKGTLFKLLKEPKPWNEMKRGRDTFTRLYNWVLMPLNVKLAIMRTREPLTVSEISEKLCPLPKTQEIELTDTQKEGLEKVFEQVLEPSKEEIQLIAEHFRLEPSAVFNFLKNRDGAGAQ